MTRRQRKQAEVREALLRRRRSSRTYVWFAGEWLVQSNHWKARARMYRALGLKL
jgi:hypothetical protein